MRVEFSKWSVVLRADAGGRWWVVPYLVIGGVIAWYATFSVDPRFAELAPFGVAFGIAVALSGLAWLLPSDTLVFDVATRVVRQTSYGLLGRKKKVLAFSKVASIGIETLQDPVSGLVWSKCAVLRRVDGKRWALDESRFPITATLDGGRGSELLVQIGKVSGLDVVNETKLRPQPLDYVAA